jgi:poly(glycerol-phosphate) alpha-glucosyltransferase
MTSACNLDVGFESGAAVRIDTDPEKMAAALSAFFAMGDRERNEMGERGIRLVQTTFLWPDIANRMRQVYEWLISGGQAPAFVVRD